jgi:hypothetical protein
LALYNRLSAILGRVRVFFSQKIELLENRGSRSMVDRQLLLTMIDSQIIKVTAKARMIQKGLFCLIGACLAFLSCSFLAAVSMINESFGIAALIAHGSGLLLFASGLVWSLRELVHSISPLEEEGAYLASLTEQHESADADLKIADAA